MTPQTKTDFDLENIIMEAAKSAGIEKVSVNRENNKYLVDFGGPRLSVELGSSISYQRIMAENVLHFEAEYDNKEIANEIIRVIGSAGVEIQGTAQALDVTRTDSFTDRTYDTGRATLRFSTMVGIAALAFETYFSAHKQVLDAHLDYIKRLNEISKKALNARNQRIQK